MQSQYIYAGSTDSTTVYDLVAESKGAGPYKGYEFVTYRDSETGQCYTRVKEDFEVRMTPIIRDVVY